MKLTDAEALARQLMQEHGLTGADGKLLPLGKQWRFKFDNAVRRFGYCSHRQQTISLSRNLVELNEEPRVRNTILHEIAHALCSPKDGHNRNWRSMARAIGCDASTYYDSNAVAAPAKKYTGHCPNCSKEIKAHRRNKIACGNCCRRYNGGKFTKEYLIVWEQ
jgi:predicted SprT family Zn-dependent metalloprotease